MLIFSLSILIIHGKILLDIILFSCTQFFFPRRSSIFFTPLVQIQDIHYSFQVFVFNVSLHHSSLLERT